MQLVKPSKSPLVHWISFSQPASRHRSSGLVFLYSSASPVDTLICMLICRNGQEWKTKKVINYERSQSESAGQTGLNPPCSGLRSRWQSCCWISQIQDKQRQEIEARSPEYKKIFFGTKQMTKEQGRIT